MDENGNTVTVSKTENDVWITEVTDPNGNPVSTEKKAGLPQGERIETINHQTGELSKVEYDMVRQKKVSFEKNPDGTKTTTVYENGRKSGSRTTHPDGSVTRTGFNQEGIPQYGKTVDSRGNELSTLGRKDFEDGSSMVWETDNRRNTTTSTYTHEDGSVIWETKDSTTGETLNGAGLNPDGSLITYQTGKYADEAFQQGEVIATNKTTAGRDWKRDAEEYQNQFRHQQQEELDQRLISQMNGGDSVTGGDLIVSSRFSEYAQTSQKEGSQQELTEDAADQIRSGYEIGQVNPQGDYEVKPLGNPVGAEGFGKTPSQALTNAINDAAHGVITHIKSEMVDHNQSTHQMHGGELTHWSSERDVRQKMESSSFVAFKDYVVESVGQTEAGEYVVKIKARPGVTTKR